MKQKKSKYVVRKPNPFIYGFVKVATWFMSTFIYNVKIIKNETKGVKEPFVVIQNHEAKIDFYSSYNTVDRVFHCVMSNSFYQVSKIRKYMDMVGAIPKQQFQTSIADLKLMKSALDQGRSLLFFPQGLMTEDGIATNVPKATGKALKWFKHDVYIAKISGTYLTNPKWSKVLRKGKPTMSIYKIFSKEDLENLSQEEVEARVEKELYFDAYENQEINKIPYKKGDLIEGIHYPLYKCPKCEKEFVMESRKNEIYCTSCGNRGYADKLGFIYPKTKEDVVFKHPSNWSRFIQKGLENEIRVNEDYYIESPCKIEKLDHLTHKLTPFGEGFGKVRLDKNGYTLTYALNGEKIDKLYDTTGIYLVPFASGKYFELQEGMDIYRIYIQNPEQISKWMNITKTFYRIRNDIKL